MRGEAAPGDATGAGNTPLPGWRGITLHILLRGDAGAFALICLQQSFGPPSPQGRCAPLTAVADKRPALTAAPGLR